MNPEVQPRALSPFNTAVEIGLRALSVLTAAYPSAYSLQKLVVFDYVVVHSDDVPNGPAGLHPQTPHRGGELLVRRGVLQEGLLLYQSRGLVEQVYRKNGVFFKATERSAAFLDALVADYVVALRERASWAVDRFGALDDRELDAIIRDKIGIWGAEFELESVLWTEDA